MHLIINHKVNMYYLGSKQIVCMATADKISFCNTYFAKPNHRFSRQNRMSIEHNRHHSLTIFLYIKAANTNHLITLIKFQTNKSIGTPFKHDPRFSSMLKNR